jgi:hypothetical protein
MRILAPALTVVGEMLLKMGFSPDNVSHVYEPLRKRAFAESGAKCAARHPARKGCKMLGVDTLPATHWLVVEIPGGIDVVR